ERSMNSGSYWLLVQRPLEITNSRSNKKDAEPSLLLPAPTKGRREQYPASAPSRGAAQALPLYFKSLAAQVGRFGRKQFSLLTQRSSCQLADREGHQPLSEFTDQAIPFVFRDAILPIAKRQIPIAVYPGI